MAIRPMALAGMLGLLALSAGSRRIKIVYDNVTELGITFE